MRSDRYTRALRLPYPFIHPQAGEKSIEDGDDTCFPLSTFDMENRARDVQYNTEETQRRL